MAKARGRYGEASTMLRVFSVCMLVFALFGLTRVALAAKVGEAAIDADRLRDDIREELCTGETLQAEQGSLASPSRIEALARASMGMADPQGVGHLSLEGRVPADSAGAGDVATTSGAYRASLTYADDRPPSAAGLIGELMDMAAGEAQFLLVGDVGLASSR